MKKRIILRATGWLLCFFGGIILQEPSAKNIVAGIMIAVGGTCMGIAMGFAMNRE